MKPVIAEFKVARKSTENENWYLLIGETETGREVRIGVDRNRLESMVINLMADSGLLRGEYNADTSLATEENVSAVNRLRVLAQLGAPNPYETAKVPNPHDEVSSNI